MKFSRLILKNILRNKRRTLLTISSLVVSLFLIITLATILTEFSRGSEASNPLRLITRHAVSLGFTLPVAQQQRIATVPGVKSVMPFSWFGGIYKDEKNFFANDQPVPAGRRIGPRFVPSHKFWNEFRICWARKHHIGFEQVSLALSEAVEQGARQRMFSHALTWVSL
jgi:putative ABC transport system permease protein